MTEAFLHYVWQHRLFDMNRLIADDGSKVEIEKPGTYNTGSGPDFFNAQLRLNGVRWNGNVEIHIRSSDWQRHDHHNDPVYDSCILHVVLENDVPTLRMNGSPIPTIQLKDRYPSFLWDNYIRLLGTRGWVACDRQIREVDQKTIDAQLEKMVNERLRQRAEQLLIGLGEMKNDWEECFYQLLARNFGFHVNALPFEMLARSVPYRILLRENGSVQTTEAILFGQAGMLESDIEEKYFRSLQQEYRFYKNKYSLRPININGWKYMRLRPVNFPTIRIAQFADLMFRSASLLSRVLEAPTLDELTKLLDCSASVFWDDHFTFTTVSERSVKRLGEESVRNLIINSVVPVCYAWSDYAGDVRFGKKAMELLRELPAEKNVMIREWEQTGVKALSAADSQALLQLKLNYCSEKNCLSCNIGNRLINSIP